MAGVGDGAGERGVVCLEGGGVREALDGEGVRAR